MLLRLSIVVVFLLSIFSTAWASPALPGNSLENLTLGGQKKDEFAGSTNEQVVLAAFSSFADFSQGEVNSEEILSQLQEKSLVGYNNYLIGEYTADISEIDQDNNIPEKKTASRASNKIITYVVQGGDTVWGISEKFGISVNTIKWANNLSDIDSLKPGQKLIILPVSGVLHTVKKGETLGKIASLYGVDLKKISEFNQISGSLSVGQKLIIPGGQPPAPPKPKTTTIASRPSSSSPSFYSGPQAGWLIRPTFGIRTRGVSSYHDGVDIANKIGTPVWAAAAGTVIHTGWYYGYGLTVMIRHANGVITLYGHLSSITVSSGQYVNQGQLIGLMGNTGRSTGPHLHFEVRGGYNPF